MSNHQSQERSVILTFDDGPEPVEALESIVAVLDAEGIKGCFFLLGQGVRRHPDAVRRLAEGGHEVGNHNWEHTSMPKLAETQMLDQLRRTQEAIGEACGVAPRRFRPPFGEGWYNEKCPALVRSAQSLGLEIMGWSLDTYDWKTPHGIRFDRVTSRFEGFVAEGRTARLDLLLHVHAETGRDLPQLIGYLRSLGFVFTTYDG